MSRDEKKDENRQPRDQKYGRVAPPGGVAIDRDEKRSEREEKDQEQPGLREEKDQPRSREEDDQEQPGLREEDVLAGIEGIRDRIVGELDENEGVVVDQYAGQRPPRLDVRDDFDRMMERKAAGTPPVYVEAGQQDQKEGARPEGQRDEKDGAGPEGQPHNDGSIKREVYVDDIDFSENFDKIRNIERDMKHIQILDKDDKEFDNLGDAKGASREIDFNQGIPDKLADLDEKEEHIRGLGLNDASRARPILSGGPFFFRNHAPNYAILSTDADVKDFERQNLIPSAPTPVSEFPDAAPPPYSSPRSEVQPSAPPLSPVSVDADADIPDAEGEKKVSHSPTVILSTDADIKDFERQNFVPSAPPLSQSPSARVLENRDQPLPSAPPLTPVSEYPDAAPPPYPSPRSEVQPSAPPLSPVSVDGDADADAQDADGEQKTPHSAAEHGQEFDPEMQARRPSRLIVGGGVLDDYAEARALARSPGPADNVVYVINADADAGAGAGEAAVPSARQVTPTIYSQSSRQAIFTPHSSHAERAKPAPTAQEDKTFHLS